MNRDNLRDLGQQCLRKLATDAAGVAEWKAYLLAYPSREEHEDDAYVWLTCALALEAVAAGNFGVGALLIDETGEVVALGHNEVFHPYFRSDRHAEMVVLDAWEDARAGLP